MEQLAPLPQKRFAAMEQIPRAGILTGTCMMPILPGLCDTDENLEVEAGHNLEANAWIVASHTCQKLASVLD
jgi:DNA repair photolyase